MELIKEITTVRATNEQYDIDRIIQIATDLSNNPEKSHIKLLLLCLHDNQINTLGEHICCILEEIYYPKFQEKYIKELVKGLSIIHPHAESYFQLLFGNFIINQNEKMTFAILNEDVENKKIFKMYLTNHFKSIREYLSEKPLSLYENLIFQLNKDSNSL